MDISMESMISNFENKNSNFSTPYTSEGLIPVTLKLLHQCLQHKKQTIDSYSFSRVVVTSRIDHIEPKGMKWQLTLNDNTGIEKAIKFNGSNEEDLERNFYYQITLNLKEEKDELVLHCEKFTKVQHVDQLLFHYLNVIKAHAHRMKNPRQKS